MAEAAAEGPITEMVEAFRAVVAASPKFQAFVGVGDAVAALGRLHVYTDGGEGVRPLGLVDVGDEFQEMQNGVNASEYSGSLILWLEKDVNAADGLPNATRLFMNAVGQICSEVRSLRFSSVSVGGPALMSWRFLIKPQRMNASGAEADDDTDDSVSDYWMAMIEFRFEAGA